MGFLHLVQGLVMYSISTDFKLPVIANFLEFDVSTQMLVQVPQTMIELPIGALVAAFLLMSAFAHFVLTIPEAFEWYKNNLKKGINYARWYEYAISSSLMIIVIAMLAGVYEFAGLLAMFFLNMMMILFGLIMELHNQTTKKTDWTSYIYGCIAGAVPWIIIAVYLLSAGEGENKAPTFVYWIFFSMFIFFNTFAINMYLQYKQVGKWKDYLYGERMYIILSLVAKSLLAWQVWAGTLRPV